jgi:hypothetical protein
MLLTIIDRTAPDGKILMLMFVIKIVKFEVAVQTKEVLILVWYIVELIKTPQVPVEIKS